MAKQRPFGVTLLAILAGLATLVAIWHTLQMLHILPVSLETVLGSVNFFTFSIIGAILWGIMAAIWLWVTRGLWNLDPQAWLFVVVMATLNLVLAFVSILGASSFGAMLPSIIVNGLALIYGMTPGVKSAFGQPT
ncbi:MAG: hypothetical protein KDD78_16360 [Caldilineaceae bacterium]|nr:hypothetical protein [Caldilineaceae bacterium]